MTREEFLKENLEGFKIQFHWICTIEDEEVRTRLQSEVAAGTMFIFAPVMFVYFKDEETNEWKHGEARFNMEEPARNVIMPITPNMIGRNADEILALKEETNDQAETDKEE